MLSSKRQQDRFRLRLLDSCLQALETANENDERVVSPALAARLGRHVPGIVAGMTIAAAHDRVLLEQEQHLHPDIVAGVPVSVLRQDDREEEPLDACGARELTERIKLATRQVCMLLFEAHRRRAWHALGYSTWDEYVQGEFGISRTRSYELLDQGRVIRAVMAAAGISGIPEISAYAAEQIKPYLGEVIDAVRERTAGVPEREAMAIVLEAVRERRALIARQRQVREQSTGGAAPDVGGPRPALPASELARLREALDRLTAMPPVPEVLAQLEREEAVAVGRVDDALRWLTDFAGEWRRRHSPARTVRAR